jgi:hypothetical protein
MQDICKNPKPTHDDMALIPAQGRDQAAVDQDIAAARADGDARRAGPPQSPKWVHEDESVAPDSDCPEA